MANWCENKLTITDPTPEFKEFVADGLSFDKIIECPFKNPEDSGKWRDWCVDNWGTKWDLNEDDNVTFAEGDTEFFNTAWSPPVDAILKLSKKFPTMSFKLDYFEGGMMFGGEVGMKNGCVELDEEHEDDDLIQFACDVFGFEGLTDEEEVEIFGLDEDEEEDEP